jgi:iron(III) transport system permease protein
VSKSPNLAIRLWLIVGLLAYGLLPWYAIQDTAWYSVLTQIFGGAETGNGLVQVLVHGRVWLSLGLIGLGLAAVGLLVPAGRSKATGCWPVACWVFWACWSAGS